MITLEQFAKCLGATVARAQPRYDPYMVAMPQFDINTLQRQAYFLANVGHETSGLQFATELWGPTESQKRYERNFGAPWPKSPEEAGSAVFLANRLAYGLGNVQRGDGRRFCGHGDIQNTGRANAVAVTKRLRTKFPELTVPDFEAEPEKLSLPQWAALSACDYIAMRNCNAQADTGNFDGYSDLINKGRVTAAIGDSNGYADRLARVKVGFAALGLSWPG